MGSFSVEHQESEGLDTLIDESAGSRAVINRYGCDLIGYRIKHPKTGQELPLMWRDSQAEPPAEGWKSHATVLFPVVGGLKNNESKLGDTVISSRGNHGFPRHSTFELVGTDTDGRASAHYRLLPNDEIRGYYPFDFVFELEFALKGVDLSVTFTITNPSDSEPLYYCFGWHPGFAAPLIHGQGKKMDCKLILADGTIRKYHNNAECRLTGETSEIQVGGPISTTEEELEATLMYEIDDPSMRWVTYEDPAAGVQIKVDFPEFPHLGFWSEPGNEFLCIEPWQGMDDHEDQEPFDQKVGVVKLAPKGVDRRTIEVTPSFS